VRVLHLVHQYPPDHVGGTELYTRAVAQALGRRDCQVAVFSRRNQDGAGRESRAENNVSVWVAWDGAMGPTRRFLATFGNGVIEEAFGEALDSFQPDLVHIQHLMGLPTSLLGHIHRQNIPFVATLHDFWWVCANAQLITNYSGQICTGPMLWLNCARCALARSRSNLLWPAMPVLALALARRGNTLHRALGRAARLIAPTSFVKEWYVQHGVPEDQIVVLPHGVERPDGLLPYDRPAHPPRFAYIGGLAWQKGVHVLLEAFARLRGTCELWIAGDESFDPAYSARLHSLASAQVRFLGPLDRDGVWETLSQVDLVVVPSLWYETFSLIVHEAFAAGVPVVVSRLGALAEAVRHQVDGIAVEPGNAEEWRVTLQALVDAPENLLRLRSQIRPPMTMEEHIDRLYAIYSDLI
jgi:glycosyltransferase involved in cell wall biosynthesis